MKILIVDDSKFNIEQAKKAFEENKINCEIEACTSGSNALKIVDSEEIDIIMLDIIMPNMTGLEVLAHLRSNPKYRDIIIIMFTSLTDKEYLRKSFELGANEFINKPIEAIEFTARLKAAIKLKSNQLALKDAFRMLEAKNNSLKSTTLKLKEMQFQLIQKEKLSAIGELAAGVAHEINNPLGYISSNHETLGKFLKSLKTILVEYRDLIDNIAKSSHNEELTNDINKIKENESLLNIDFILEDIDDLMNDSRDGIQKVSKIVKSLRNFARTDNEDEYNYYNVNDIIDETLLVIKNEWKYSITIEKIYGDSPDIYCNRGQIEQVILNLIINSIQAIKEYNKDQKGNITIKTTCDDNYTYTSIEDNGPGIKKELLNKIFNPFFTTKDVGKGTGLGLSISHDIIVNKHKGELDVKTEVGKGTIFTIKLPLTKVNDAIEEN
ncbi:ATP-binding protein [Clostridium tagluense]|uniref:ATP-binding protein n=1 Tax=Clostridium tagluense TaxID=360422 RepID=UPI001CF50821|nr:ATP-binding protein [Clostridium tagluense]MCB2296212.1 response regulator [Clostridium tagluense]